MAATAQMAIAWSPALISVKTRFTSLGSMIVAVIVLRQKWSRAKDPNTLCEYVLRV